MREALERWEEYVLKSAKQSGGENVLPMPSRVRKQLDATAQPTLGTREPPILAGLGFTEALEAPQACRASPFQGPVKGSARCFGGL